MPCHWRLAFGDSVFFNDVWQSENSGTDWSLVTPSHGAPWAARAYYNDVYRSRDGRHWQKMTEDAPWAPRAGAVVVSRGAYMYMLGGEDGFVCNPFTPRCPPYFNDVWKSNNGRDWTLVTAAAGWSPAQKTSNTISLPSQSIG